ncbi:MAG: 1-deoxy-D-xylulose-5-phosphate synthase N-terminal domain-containing protein [Candidatus Portnoybacteria bacterium]|nr:1-deoxy-D-xylulose-5-phosphate synthase N-terminal domain-containing protein [Candidatus Portnoybacteria bacterium]
MYNVLDEKELEALRQSDAQRVLQLEGGNFYLNLKGLELALMEGLEIERINNLARIVRGLSFAAIEGVKSGHPGGSSSKVEQLLALLVSGVLAFDPENPKHPGRDRVVWSAGHCTPLHHSILALIYESLSRQGKKMDKEVLGYSTPLCLARFRHCDGPSGHVESRYALADASTGASGHGFSMGLGLALLQKSNGLDSKVFIIAGDAETEEGMSYEARNSIVSMGADNIIVTLDNNNFGIDGPITDVISTNYLNHWAAMGWNLIEVDGHNILELVYAYKKARQGFGNSRPTVVICHTIKGKDYGKTAGTADSHGAPAPHPEYVEIMKKLGFNIPGAEGEIKKDLEVVVSGLTNEDASYFFDRLKEGREKLVDEKELVEKIKKTLAGRSLADYKSVKRPEALPADLIFKAGESVATRKATEAFFKWLMSQTAFFYIGSGDLAKSILTIAAENVYGIINQKNPLGRGFRFGIAEQNMAMMSASMTQDILPGGFQAMSVFSTYGVFTSIMGNAVRMALINNAVNPAMKGFFIMLAAHDGAETAEDGSTHQGLFWMSLFDAYPGIKVYKPLDANETIEMLFFALQKGEPVAFSIMRPGTPVFERGQNTKYGFAVPEAKEAVNGAYVFKPFNENGKPKKVFAICGGQVMANVLALLKEFEEKADIKIIAVTSPELFEELRRENPEKANSILSDEERQYVVTLHNGWSGFLHRFLLPGDYEKRTIEIDKFLKSGPVGEVYKLAEFDAEGLREQILKAIE